MSTSVSKSQCGFARFDLTILDLFRVKIETPTGGSEPQVELY